VLEKNEIYIEISLLGVYIAIWLVLKAMMEALPSMKL